MSITVVALNHSSYPDYWAPCINIISRENSLTNAELNMEELWEINSNFDWNIRLKSITEELKTTTLIFLAYGTGAFLLKSWLKANQTFINKFTVHAILIDSPPVDSLQNNMPLEKLIKMDRSSYKNEVLKVLKEQSAASEWIQSIPSKTNYLKALLLEIYEKTKLLDDSKPLIPLLEEWHEVYSYSLPLSSAQLLKQRRVSLPNWQSFELLGPNLPVFPTPNLVPKIQGIIADILCRSRQ